MFHVNDKIKVDKNISEHGPIGTIVGITQDTICNISYHVMFENPEIITLYPKESLELIEESTVDLTKEIIENDEKELEYKVEDLIIEHGFNNIIRTVSNCLKPSHSESKQNKEWFEWVQKKLNNCMDEIEIKGLNGINKGQWFDKTGEPK